MTHRAQQSPTPSAVRAAIEQLQLGNFVVVADDTDRENEGDLIGLADRMTPESMAFLVRHTSGVVCVAMSGERLDALQIPLMVTKNTDSQATAFTVTVDYIPATTTGISAHDRSATVRALGNFQTQPEDFSRPGHVFPLRARPSGVLERRGHTEAAVDLARLAGATPAAAIAELMHDDGTMMRGHKLREFARTHDLAYLTIEDLVRYRRSNETLVEHTGSSRLPTRHGDFVAHAYRSALDGIEHLALVYGDVNTARSVLTRLHSECLTGDALGSLRCDCGPQLELALRQIALEGAGVLVYMRGHEGRGIGLADKIRAYSLQDSGRDTVDANLDLGLPVDARRYDTAAQILRHQGVGRVRLLSNNPTKVAALEASGIRVHDRVPLIAPLTVENGRYLSTKALRLGHLLSRPLAAAPAAFDQQRVAPKAMLDEHQRH